MVAVILHLGNIKFSQRKAPKKKETPVMIANRDGLYFNSLFNLSNTNYIVIFLFLFF